MELAEGRDFANAVSTPPADGQRFSKKSIFDTGILRQLRIAPAFQKGLHQTDLVEERERREMPFQNPLIGLRSLKLNRHTTVRWEG